MRSSLPASLPPCLMKTNVPPEPWAAAFHTWWIQMAATALQHSPLCFLIGNQNRIIMELSIRGDRMIYLNEAYWERWRSDKVIWMRGGRRGVFATPLHSISERNSRGLQSPARWGGGFRIKQVSSPPAQTLAHSIHHGNDIGAERFCLAVFFAHKFLPFQRWLDGKFRPSFTIKGSGCKL